MDRGHWCLVYSSPWSCFCCFPFLTSPSSDEHSVCLYDDSFTEGFCSGRRSYLCRSCNLCVTWQSHVSGRFLPPNMNLTVAPPTTVTCVMTSESESEVAQSCPTLCDPMDCSPPGSSVHGIFQARILEWVAISFSRGSSPPRD